jgi:hypothetical protein
MKFVFVGKKQLSCHSNIILFYSKELMFNYLFTLKFLFSDKE